MTDLLSLSLTITTTVFIEISTAQAEITLELQAPRFSLTAESPFDAFVAGMCLFFLLRVHE